ncbi:Metalloenzyme, LuxS/M16 peptidase-like protein [Irpex rosettiformis]|uniref:Metalloenzyme, LuxS/M16 peptidase-like protein n=1 Tax=Irpex rosettiformis TaxID=378272 RepID=A0ACB8UJI6_9APHY|nr:Metalloenzyme, LuxS/M16 peptidase-like protein [Irpex rosettiformis]
MRRASYGLRHALQRRTLQTHAAPLKELSPSSVEITTLPNKIRVATENTPGHFSAVGLYIDAGTRYETPTTSGVSHFLDRMAFKTTTSRSDLDMALAMDKLGGQILCSSSRESMMYQSSHFHSATPLALSLIADTVREPAFLQEEIEAQRDAAYYEIREVNSKPEMILPEVLHHVAYGEQGLGNPLLCPPERVDQIDRGALQQFMETWYRPERMVVAGAGMPHEELVELVDKHFSSLKFQPSPTPQPTTSRSTQQPSPQLFPSSQQPSLYKSFTRAASFLSPSLSPTSLPPLNLSSTYSGGHRFIQDTSSEFNHLYLAYEGVGIHDDDVYTLATMQVLLGGGGSFSAGGPGKGMYSRLYTHILNHYPNVDHCASFHHIYTDSSLFGLFVTFLPQVSRNQGNTSSQMLPHLVHQLSLLLYSPIPEGELQRAKNQLKSSLMMALESRGVEVEDLGRQILVHNRKIPVQEMCNKIDEVTPETVRRVAQRVFGPGTDRKASVVVNGRDDVKDYQATLRKYGVGHG